MRAEDRVEIDEIEFQGSRPVRCRRTEVSGLQQRPVASDSTQRLVTLKTLGVGRKFRPEDWVEVIERHVSSRSVPGGRHRR